MVYNTSVVLLAKPFLKSHRTHEKGAVHVPPGDQDDVLQTAAGRCLDTRIPPQPSRRVVASYGVVPWRLMSTRPQESVKLMDRDGTVFRPGDTLKLK